MHYQLRGISQPHRGLLYEIPTERPFVLGRMSTADIRVNDATVSRKHCTLIQTGDILMVRDENSVNGSYVNGVRLNATERRLVHRDILQVGKVALMVEEVAEPVADEPIYIAANAG